MYDDASMVRLRGEGADQDALANDPVRAPALSHL